MVSIFGIIWVFVTVGYQVGATIIELNRVVGFAVLRGSQ
jgi:hypothetical protein